MKLVERDVLARNHLGDAFICVGVARVVPDLAGRKKLFRKSVLAVKN